MRSTGTTGVRALRSAPPTTVVTVAAAAAATEEEEEEEVEVEANIPACVE
jgi:hypothetical protein